MSKWFGLVYFIIASAPAHADGLDDLLDLAEEEAQREGKVKHSTKPEYETTHPANINDAFFHVQDLRLSRCGQFRDSSSTDTILQGSLYNRSWKDSKDQCEYYSYTACDMEVSGYVYQVKPTISLEKVNELMSLYERQTSQHRLSSEEEDKFYAQRLNFLIKTDTPARRTLFDFEALWNSAAKTVDVPLVGAGKVFQLKQVRQIKTDNTGRFSFPLNFQHCFYFDKLGEGEFVQINDGEFGSGPWDTLAMAYDDPVTAEDIERNSQNFTWLSTTISTNSQKLENQPVLRWRTGANMRVFVGLPRKGGLPSHRGMVALRRFNYFQHWLNAKATLASAPGYQQKLDSLLEEEKKLRNSLVYFAEAERKKKIAAERREKARLAEQTRQRAQQACRQSCDCQCDLRYDRCIANRCTDSLTYNPIFNSNERCDPRFTENCEKLLRSSVHGNTATYECSGYNSSICTRVHTRCTEKCY